MNKTISEKLSQAAKTVPEKLIGLGIKGCENISYSNFEKRINDLAKGFLLRNITPQTKVLLFITNDRYSIESFIALTKIGASVYTVKQTENINQLIINHKIETIIMPYKAALDLFKPEILAKQNREYLNFEEFPKLQTIVLLDPIKLRGAFNLQELILLGKHIDDTEIEEIILAPLNKNYSVFKIEIKDNTFETIKLPIKEISIENFPFFDLKKL